MTEFRGGPPDRDASSGPDDTGDHFDTDTLADHTEGLLEPARDAHVQAHLAWCTECGGVVDQLNSVRTVLSSLPTPTMPDDVVQRIDDNLANEQLERASMTPSDRQGEQRQRRSWVSALFHRPGLLAGAAVFVVGVAFLGGYLSSRGGDDSGAQPPEKAVPTITDGGPMITGRTYTTAELGGQARALLEQKESGSYTPDPSMSKKVDEEMERLSDPQEFQQCAAAVTRGDTGRVQAVDLSTFDKQPAAIVVMTTKDTDTLEVAAVGPGCTKGDAKIIYRTEVPRR